MSQQQLSRFVSPVTQSLDDTHMHLSNLSVAYRDVNTKLQTHANRLVAGTQGFQGNGANTFSSLINYYTGVVEKHCQALDDGANAARNCSIQINNAVDSASYNNLDTTIVGYVLSRVTLDDIILQGGSAIDPIMQQLMSTWQHMQNTWDDLQKTYAHEDALMNAADNAADQEWKDLFALHFGAVFNDVGHYWGDQWQTVGDWVHELSYYAQLGAEGLQLLWEAIQLAWRVLSEWGDQISQAIRRCLSSISAISTTAIDDISTFMPEIGPISEILKDAQTALNDEEKGDDLGALAALADMLVNPELMLDGLQPLSQGQMEQILIKDAPWLLETFKKLPMWAKIAIVALVVAGLAGLLLWTRVNQSSVPRAIKNLHKQSQKQWQNLKPKDRAQMNFGGGQLAITGQGEPVLDKNRKPTYDTNGQPIMTIPTSEDTSGFRTSPDPRYPGKHVEEQVIDWTVAQIEQFREEHGNAPLNSLTLNLYTFKTPCGVVHNNCALQLQPGGPWEQRIKKAAGIQDDKNVQITVYTSNGNPSVPIQLWP